MLKYLLIILIPSTAFAGQSLLDWLKSQPAVPEDTTTKFDRSLWDVWNDVDKDCQDTRVEVLIRESKASPGFDASNKCKVIQGQWTSWYSLTIVTDPKSLDVDHIVPLKEAHESGAAKWSKEQKSLFANDLTKKRPQLRAVTASENRSKGAKEPHEWLPRENACAYVEDWTWIKHRWKLNFDDVEKSFLIKTLEICKNTKKERAK